MRFHIRHIWLALILSHAGGAALADPPAFREDAVLVGATPEKLAGLLTVPLAAGPFPAVILVHGSGPNDRDETIGANRPFKDLAQGLAARGIAVLRYDKRTYVYPKSFMTLEQQTVQDETIDDVLAAIQLLRSRREIDPGRIVVLGHSLGGTLAPRIAGESNVVRAIVILAGATRPLPDLIMEQVLYLFGTQAETNPQIKQQIAALREETRKALAAKPGDSGARILGVPPSYWGDLNSYDPAAAAARLTLPILILQGGRDYQVGTADLARFRTALAGHANVEIVEFANLNHLFMPGSGASTPQEYQSPNHVDGAVVETIARFIGKL